MSKLEEAIEAGKNEAKRLKEIADQKQAEKLALEKIAFEKYVESAFNSLCKDDQLFNLIKEAVIKNEKSITLQYGSRAHCVAINRHNNDNDIFAGIKADYYEGHDYINSDEVKQDWCHVVVKWSSNDTI